MGDQSNRRFLITEWRLLHLSLTREKKSGFEVVNHGLGVETRKKKRIR